MFYFPSIDKSSVMFSNRTFDSSECNLSLAKYILSRPLGGLERGDRQYGVCLSDRNSRHIGSELSTKIPIDLNYNWSEQWTIILSPQILERVCIQHIYWYIAMLLRRAIFRRYQWILNETNQRWFPLLPHLNVPHNWMFIGNQMVHMFNIMGFHINTWPALDPHIHTIARTFIICVNVLNQFSVG